MHASPGNPPNPLRIGATVLPPFLYGTAWKGDETERLVGLALEAGFRGFDTANQRKHYFEAGVGKALRKAFSQGPVCRADLFLQTKFTFAHGQDHRLPYHPEAAPAQQVRESFASSLEHLGVDFIDAFILHGPSTGAGLATADLEVWQAMTELQAQGKTRFLGVSNVSLEQLALLCEQPGGGPAMVQKRCFANTGWDRDVRRFCKHHGIVYQGFSLLTANARELLSDKFRRLAKRIGGTIPQIVFSFAHRLGILPLTGTTDPAHMQEDLACDLIHLRNEDVAEIETIGGDEPKG